MTEGTASNMSFVSAKHLWISMIYEVINFETGTSNGVLLTPYFKIMSSCLGFECLGACVHIAVGCFFLTFKTHPPVICELQLYKQFILLMCCAIKGPAMQSCFVYGFTEGSWGGMRRRGFISLIAGSRSREQLPATDTQNVLNEELSNARKLSTW